MHGEEYHVDDLIGLLRAIVRMLDEPNATLLDYTFVLWWTQMTPPY